MEFYAFVYFHFDLPQEAFVYLKVNTIISACFEKKQCFFSTVGLLE